jgi:hypothetical protein
MSSDAPVKPWETRGPRAPLHLAMTFEDDVLVLGAGTRLGLAKRSLIPRRQDSETFDEARVKALLAVACGRQTTPSQLAHVRDALEKQSEGQTTLALVHLALAGLPTLQPPAEAAWRLSAADELMKRGMAPSELLKALGLGPAARETLERAYNPDQPRVPAGSGRASGQWASGDDADEGAADDATSPASATHDTASSGSRGVQIADDSDDWLPYLNPISTAQAAGSGRAPFNGVGPNAQHQTGVEQAQALYQAHGFILASEGAVAVTVPGFATPRVYDFVAQDPVAGAFIGVEVNTTMYDTIFFDSSQVDKDVAIYDAGGGSAPSLAGKVTRVAYEAFCAHCPMANLGRASLVLRLVEAGVRVRAYQYPGQDEFD